MLWFANNLPFRTDSGPLGPEDVRAALAARYVKTRHVLVPQRAAGGNFGVAWLFAAADAPLYRAPTLFGRHMLYRAVPGVEFERPRKPTPVPRNRRPIEGKWRKLVAERPELSEGQLPDRVVQPCTYPDERDRRGRYDDEPYDGTVEDRTLCRICHRRPPVSVGMCERCVEPICIEPPRRLADGTWTAGRYVPTEFDLDEGLRYLYRASKLGPLSEKFGTQFRRAAEYARFYARVYNGDLSLIGTRLQKL